MPSVSRHFIILATVGLGFLALTHDGAAAMDAGTPLVVPLIGLDGGDVRQCGIRVLSGPESEGIAVDIALERHGASADLVMRAVITGGAHDHPITDVRIEGDTALTRGTDEPANIISGVERRSPAADEAATDFIRAIMLRGARVLITQGGARSQQQIDISGPLPQSVRAAYLNCAGDLYRPGE